MKKALIFAGSSFVGRHVAAKLAQAGVAVTCTARRPGAASVTCDVTVPDQVSGVIASTRPDWIIQCAGATRTVSRLEMDRLHVGATRNVLEAAARHVPGAVALLLGSAAEYGNVDPASLPSAEHHPARPQSAYGQSKLAQLRLAEKIARDLGVRVLVVRPFNLLGPDLPHYYLPTALSLRLRDQIASGRRQGPFPVGNSNTTRDWVDVRDLAEAVAGLLENVVPGPGSVDIYNVASGIETTLLALAQELCRLAGNFTAVSAAEEPSRSGIVRSCGDAGRLRATIGWEPRVPWEHGLADLWQHTTPQRRAA